MRRRLALGVALCGVLLASSAAVAGGLQAAFEAALQHDASFQAALAELASAREATPLARAALRPTVSVSVSDSLVQGSRSTTNLLGQPVQSDLDYRAPSQSLNLRMPLYHREARQKLGLAESQVRHAEAVFRVRGNELAERLTAAYLQRSLADQVLLAAQAQVDAAQVQLSQAQRQMGRGEGTRPEVAEAAAGLSLAQVQLREAEDQRSAAQLALQHLSGAQATPGQAPTAAAVLAVTGLPAAASPWAGVGLAPAGPLGDWLARAEAQNPVLAARREAVAMAESALARNAAGHHPRLDLVASVSSARNDSVSTLNQSIQQRTLGLQFNLPLYSGGAVDASVRQGRADLDKARAELLAEQQLQQREIAGLYATAAQGAGRIAAHQQAEAASALALEGARKSLAAGLASQGDVAQAQRKLAQARRELARASHELLLDHLRLLLRSGLDAAAAVAQLDARMPAVPGP